MKKLILFTLILGINSSTLFAQNSLENKIFYGKKIFHYKYDSKGKLGEVKNIILKFSDSTVIQYSYQRFLYNQIDTLDQIMAPNGYVKQNKNNFTIQNNQVNFKNKNYQKFIYQNNTLKAYINSDFENHNKADRFIEISHEQLDSLFNSNEFNK